MEIIDKILSMIKATRINRHITLPGSTNEPGKQAYIQLDAAGNETIIINADYDRAVSYMVASIQDIVDFAGSIVSRYGAGVAMGYRELTVFVDNEDIPTRFMLASAHDDLPLSSVSYELKPHRDFSRWMKAKDMTQLEFRSLLLEQADQHDQPNLAGLLSVLKYSTVIDYEASVETERNFVLAFSEKEAKGCVDLPKMLVVNCPVFSGARLHTEITFELVIKKPKSEGEKIKFSLVPYGKSVDVIKRDAALVIAETEFIAPVQAALSEGVFRIPAMYLREDFSLKSFSKNREAILQIK